MNSMLETKVRLCERISISSLLGGETIKQLSSCGSGVCIELPAYLNFSVLFVWKYKKMSLQIARERALSLSPTACYNRSKECPRETLLDRFTFPSPYYLDKHKQ